MGAANPAKYATTPDTTCWSSGPIQLCYWSREQLGWWQKKRGVVGFIAEVATHHPRHHHPSSLLQCQQHLLLLQTLTIVLTGMPIGRLDGVLARRSGVAVCTARDALRILVDVELPQSHMIAKPGLQIGWLAGRLQRKRGVASIRARGARQQQEVVPEGVRRAEFFGFRCCPSAGACAPSSCVGDSAWGCLGYCSESLHPSAGMCHLRVLGESLVQNWS